MRVGMAAVFQNPGRVRSDFDVYRDDLRLADLCEPLGFDSIWSVEHHFTDYTMCPDVLQFLTYMAGRTTRVALGSMVVVLPWHDPMRVAEQISMLDNLSGGRMILGLGRGAGKVEFEGLRVPMDESRERFVEYARMLLEGLEKGYCEFDGQFVSQPRADIRPAPFKSFRGRTYAAAVSPESVARGRQGARRVPRALPADQRRRAACADLGGVDFLRSRSGARARAGHAVDRRYFHTVLDHYQFGGDHMAKTKGYEYYAKMADKIHTYGDEKVIDFFVDLQVWGTPEQCYEKILDIRRRVGNDHFVGVFSYAGMPAAEAERNMRLFAKEVMPALQRLEQGASR
jgi:alkanesulfonate monooxygenase SsuD/methylene tetrahydromethanopterin reductase-like flavin-dependent oxidoreductase (luciferase family)